MDRGEIIIYQTPDGATNLDVRLADETIWLTQAQMVMLFGRDQSVISKHISNIFKESELEKNLVYAKFAYTATDGKSYDVEHYNLDVIISVGYRVKSQRGTKFRIWANKVLKEYIVKGYVINQKAKVENNILPQPVAELKKRPHNPRIPAIIKCNRFMPQSRYFLSKKKNKMSSTFRFLSTEIEMLDDIIM